MPCLCNGTRNTMCFYHQICMTGLRCRYLRNATSMFRNFSKVNVPYITCSRCRPIVIVLKEYVFSSCNIVFYAQLTRTIISISCRQQYVVIGVSIIMFRKKYMESGLNYLNFVFPVKSIT